jgi:hypothetical protein
VLKNRATGKELFVVVISLIPAEEGAEAPEQKVKEAQGGGDDDVD